MKKIIIPIFTILLAALAIPLTPRAQTPVACEEEYVVQVGDTLASIAEQTLNDPLAYPALVALSNAAPDDEYANIDDPNVVEEGWTICIPSQEDLPDLLVEGGPIVQALARAAGIEPPPPLQETLWVLVGSGDPDDPTVVEPGTVVTAQFSETGALTGSGGCNNYTLNYEVDDDKNLAVRGPAGVTQQICPIGNEQEAAFLEALQKAKNYQITADGFLLVEYDAGLLRSETLIFVAGQSQLKDTQWVLQAYGNPEDLQPVEPATTVTAVFTGQPNLNQGAIVGFGGCNSYSADYVVQDNRLIVRPPLGTLAFCEVGSDQEAIYLALLGEAETFEIVGKQLTITGPNGVLVYSSANLPLEQVQWTLESFGGPAAQQPIPAGLEITALFVPNQDSDEADNEDAFTGTVSGSSGCNNYNATYQKELRQLTIGPAAATRMACLPAEQDAELAFFAALDTVARYQVLGDQLRLFYDGGDKVITFRANRTPLEETYWKLISYGDVEQPQLPVAGAEVTAVFEERPNAPSGVVAGSTGCNSFSSVYAASLTGIKVNPPINTLTFCGGDVGRMERAYLQGLAGATQYNIVGNALQVVYNNGDQALNFVASQPPLVPPTAVIEGPSRAQVGDTVTFSGVNSQGPESNIVQFSWDFGDGVTAEGQVVEHIYGTAGFYTARLTVVDERGVSSSTTTEIEITNPPAEGPVAVIEGPTRAFVGQDVTFQGGNSIPGSNPITVYAWGVDQLQATSANSDVSFTIRFDQPGVYDVTLAVTDQNGLSDSAGLRIEIFPREEPQDPPTAVIEGPTEAVVGQDITFQGGNSIPGSTPIVVYAWGVNGAQPTSNAADVRFTTRFDQPGQYEVSLTVTDQNGLSNTSSLIINVSEEPPAEGPAAVIEGPTQAFVGEDVTFQGGNSIPGSSPIAVYAWGIDGPQPASSPDVSFTTRFNQPGVYNVTLTVTDQNGLSNSAPLQVSVQPTLEGAIWVLSGTLPGTAITAQFDGASIGGSSGCNTYSGTYASTRTGGPSNNITVGELITTQLACEEAAMNQEQAYLAALSSAQSYTIQGNSLTIAHAGGTLTFQGEPR